jgi:thiol-disulfide isomerase/thioredoxin
MKTILLLIALLFSSECLAQDFSGYTNLPAEKRKHFVPFSIDSIDNRVAYDNPDFTVMELSAANLKQLAKVNKYTWVVIWAPWCAGTTDFAKKYLEYEEELKDKDLRLVFVAVAYGPEGIRKGLAELNYQKPAYVIPYVPGADGVKIFRKELNSSFRYRNANHYIFDRDKGLIYTGSIDIMPFEKLKKALNQ